jgi:hypothetical protein
MGKSAKFGQQRRSKMGDMGDYFNEWREHKKAMRAEHGVDCPQCKIVRPKAHPSILLPQQRCKVDGYRDPRPRLDSGPTGQGEEKQDE